MADDPENFDVNGTQVPAAALSPATQQQLANRQAVVSAIPGSSIVPAIGAGIDAVKAAAPSVGAAAQNAFGMQSNPLAAAPAAGAGEGLLPPPSAAPSGPVDPSMFTAPPAAAAPQKLSLIPTEQSSTVTRGPSLDKTQVQTMDKDFKSKQVADQRFADQQADVARRQSEQQQAYQEEEQQSQAEEVKRQQAQDEQLAQATAKGAELAQNIGKVDPKQYKKDQGIGGNILSALAVGLGTLGSGLSHGPNTAMQIYNDRVNANIAAQEKAIDTQKDQATLQNTRIGQIMSQGHDMRSAIQLDRASRYADLQRALEGEAAKTNDQTIQAKAQQMASAAKQQYDDAMVQYQQGAKAHITTTTQKQLGVNGVPVGKGKAENVPAATAEKLSDIDGAVSGIDKLLAQLKSPKDAPGALAAVAQHFGGTDATKYNDTRNAVLPAISKANDLTLSERNKEIVEGLLPGASKAGFNPETAKRQLMQQKALLIQKRQAQIKTLSGAGFNTSALGSGADSAPSSFRPVK